MIVTAMHIKKIGPASFVFPPFLKMPAISKLKEMSRNLEVPPDKSIEPEFRSVE